MLFADPGVCITSKVRGNRVRKERPPRNTQGDPIELFVNGPVSEAGDGEGRER